MSPVSSAFPTVEAVRWSLNSNGNKQTQSINQNVHVRLQNAHFITKQTPFFIGSHHNERTSQKKGH